MFAELARLAAVFQSTPLREGRRCAPCGTCPNGDRFNPRPSVRGDQQELTLLNQLVVSIHAPP